MKIEESDSIPSFSGERGVVNASKNDFSGMINKSNDIEIVKIERNSNARNFVLIVNGVIPKAIKNIEIKSKREMKYSNNVNDVGVNIKARSKPVNILVMIMLEKGIEPERIGL